MTALAYYAGSITFPLVTILCIYITMRLSRVTALANERTIMCVELVSVAFGITAVVVAFNGVVDYRQALSSTSDATQQLIRHIITDCACLNVSTDLISDIPRYVRDIDELLLTTICAGCFCSFVALWVCSFNTTHTTAILGGAITLAVTPVILILNTIGMAKAYVDTSDNIVTKIASRRMACREDAGDSTATLLLHRSSVGQSCFLPTQRLADLAGPSAQCLETCEFGLILDGQEFEAVLCRFQETVYNLLHSDYTVLTVKVYVFTSFIVVACSISLYIILSTRRE
jgi:hypothetical protein